MREITKNDYVSIIEQNPSYVNVDRAMEILECTRKTIYKYIKTGKIEHYFEKGLLMVSVTSLLAYLSELACDDFFDRSTYEKIRQYYSKICAPYPNRLNIRQVTNITGYGKTSVQQWIHKGWLTALRAASRYIIPKEPLVDFLCSQNFRTIRVKSEKHKEDITKY